MSALQILKAIAAVLTAIGNVLKAVLANAATLADIKAAQEAQRVALLGLAQVEAHQVDMVAEILQREKQIQADLTLQGGILDTANILLNDILALLELPEGTASIDRVVVFKGQTVEGDSLVIKDNEQFDITLANPKDAKGQPSAIDPTKTTFVIDNPYAILTPGADGLTCNVKGATVGSGQISGSVTDATDPTDVIQFTPLHLDVIGSATATIDVTTGPVTQQ